MKQLLVSSLILCSFVACSSSPTAPSPPQQAQYTLSAVSSPSVGGSVAVSPSQTQFASGTSVSLTATAAAGYQFSAWQGDLTGSTNPTAVVTNTNMTVTAVFTATQQQPELYTLSVFAFPQDGGSIGISPNQTQHNSGSIVTLTASAAPGFRFFQWEGHAAGSANPIAVVVDTNYTVTAWFIAIQEPLMAGLSARTVAGSVGTPEPLFGEETGTAGGERGRQERASRQPATNQVLTQQPIVRQPPGPLRRVASGYDDLRGFASSAAVRAHVLGTRRTTWMTRLRAVKLSSGIAAAPHS